MMSQIAARARRIMVCLCFGLTVASAADAASRQSAQALSDDPALEYAPDTVLIKFKPSAQPAQKRQAYAAVGGQKIRGYDLVRGLEHLQLGRGQRVEQAVERLQQLPFVEYVEPILRVAAGEVRARAEETGHREFQVWAEQSVSL